jgi:hypothetical protein
VWLFNRLHIPANLSFTSTEARIKEGGAHVTKFKTDCAYTPTADIHLAYGGTTDIYSGVQSDACTRTTDTYNVVDFGDLAPSDVAITCTRLSTIASELSEADLRFNGNPVEEKFFDSNTKPTTCDSRLDLEGTATHERGHVFGLNDLDPVAHPNLTMRGTKLTGCSLEMRTLGYGDLKGLNDLY